MLIRGVSFLVGSIVNGAAVNVAMLLIGWILLGVGVGFANQVICRSIIITIILVYPIDLELA